MKKILVPTDFSELSRFAVEYGVMLSKRHGSELIIAHFEDRPIGDMSLHLTGEAHGDFISEDSLYNIQLFRANKSKLKGLADTYGSDEVNITTLQLGGGFMKGIKHYAETESIDLIVIGTTGEESVQEFFSGNHTEQLIEQVSTPLISIQTKTDGALKDVVLGIDLTEEAYAPEVLGFIKEFLKDSGAVLHIVNIVAYEIPDNLLEGLNEFAKKGKLENYQVDVVQGEKTCETLLGYAKEQRAGLVITITEARPGFFRFIQNSFAARLTKQSKIPVLTINKRSF